MASPYKKEECRRELIETLALLLQNVPPSNSPALETSILIFRQAYNIEKSPAVRFLVENCFNLVNFIVNSRLSPDHDNVSVKHLSNTFSSPQPSESFTKSSFKPSEEVVEIAVPKIQKETSPLIKPNNEKFTSKNFQTVDTSKNLQIVDTSTQGLKRKNEISSDSVASARKIEKTIESSEEANNALKYFFAE